ncbi:hypothetical protein CHARACLAT_002999, partial [Characodon lateralis]|nr:hypothetical protein [Characodon lateralis]
VDSNYILSHIAPELSPHGSIKQAKETKILEYFQDFLYEREDTQPAENEETQTKCSSGDAVDDWAGTQTFAFIRNSFKVTAIFDHNCLEHTPGHTVCYPVVSACTSSDISNSPSSRL